MIISSPTVGACRSCVFRHVHVSSDTCMSLQTRACACLFRHVWTSFIRTGWYPLKRVEIVNRSLSERVPVMCWDSKVPVYRFKRYILLMSDSISMYNEDRCIKNDYESSTGRTPSF